MRGNSLIKRSVTLWKRLLPGLMLSRLISILCHMMAAAPLLLLLYPALQPVAWCSLLLYWLLIPAMRHNHAEMLMAAHRDGVYVPLHLVSNDGYGRKLLRTLGDHALQLVSLLPLMACIAYAMQLYYGTTDSFTVLRDLSTVIENGDWLDGLVNRIGVVLMACVPFVLCRALLSAGPYTRALNASRAFLRGSHLRLCGVWLVGLVAYLPFLLISGIAAAMYAASCTGSIVRLIMDGGALPSPAGLVAACVAALVITQPLCMLRQMLLSTFVNDIAEKKGVSVHDAA